MEGNDRGQSAREEWYPFHPKSTVFFRLIGVLWGIGVVLSLFMERRLSILGCLIAAMFFAWDTELRPITLENTIGRVFHWVLALFFFTLVAMTIWFLFFPIRPS